ncbi:hypothetical protein F4083_08395 [Candidatus Poribacteria bacterium]|nr:hypothetical protein [Candidatus Poribacteria bacterium]MYF57258.1 hypothetical protein [Candidatus Poribacteria bacterium]MYI94326.1 hypothetical protein [Candidatus Poribacteria bacterium]
MPVSSKQEIKTFTAGHNRMEQNMETLRTSDIEEESIGLWHNCPQCRNVSFRGELERNGYICPKCKVLFPLSVENRIRLLLGELSSEIDDMNINENEDTEYDVLTSVETVDEYPVSLFVLTPDSPLLKKHLTVFSDAIENALTDSIPFLSVFTASPIETEVSFADIVPLLLKLETLAEQTIPHLTVLTETDRRKLTTHLPVGEIIIAECTSQSDNAARFHPQPALHAPEEQLLPEKNRDSNLSVPDISIDCYVPRPEMHEVLVQFLRFFAFTTQ